MRTLPPYEPEPGSLQARVLDLFARNQEENFTASDLALKFDVSSQGLQARLDACINRGLLCYGRFENDTSKSWYIGPNFAAWHAARASARASQAAAPAPAPMVAKGSGARDPAPRAVVPPELITAAAVHRKLPIPPVRQNLVDMACAQLWDSLEVDDCAELPNHAAMRLAAWCAKHKLRVTVRKLSPTTKGVWKLPPAAPRPGATA